MVLFQFSWSGVRPGIQYFRNLSHNSNMQFGVRIMIESKFKDDKELMKEPALCIDKATWAQCRGACSAPGLRTNYCLPCVQERDLVAHVLSNPFRLQMKIEAQRGKEGRRRFEQSCLVNQRSDPSVLDSSNLCF